MAIIVCMRRFIALLGAMLLLVGVRLYKNGLINCGYEGKISTGTFDTCEMESVPLLIDGAHRLDLVGGQDVAYGVMKNLDARPILCENVDGIILYYACSPRLCDPVEVKGEKVNLMIAINGNNVAVGTPLLYGSY